MAFQSVTAGMVGEDVARVQRYLAQLHESNPYLYPTISVNGTYDAATVAAMKVFQKQMKIPQTGNWNGLTYSKASALTKYVSKGKTSNPYTAYPNTLGNDRSYIVGQYQALYGKPPTAAELDRDVTRLQSGMARSTLTANLEKQYAGESVTKIFADVYGRDPTEAERATWEGKLRAGTTTRTTMRQYLSGTHEALTREPTTAPVEGAEDSKAMMDSMLDDLGLGGLKGWAWEQIQAGHSPTRLMQDMRQTEEYKARFAGIVQRVDQGYPAMSEEEYLAYEESAAQIMRSNGLPAAFQNQAAYADLIAGNVSLAELNDRVQEGFVRVNTAPVEVRNKFAEWFGPAGDAALASFFLSKDRSIPALREQIAAAEIGGIGQQFDLDFTYDRAQQIAQAGVDKDTARQGFAEIEQLDPLFNETISEEEDLTAVDEGADAVFQLGGDAATRLERRGRERVAATSGGGGAAMGSRGTGAGTSD